MSKKLNKGTNPEMESVEKHQRFKSIWDLLYFLIQFVIALLGTGILATLVTVSYQSRETGVKVLSEREKAESELRANMFSNLIGPLVGFPKGQREAEMTQEQIRRERVLVELLTLNFHESFELKPLLEDVYKRLPIEKEKRSLRSVARRVIDRQISELLKKEVYQKDRKIIDPVKLAFESPPSESSEFGKCVNDLKEKNTFIRARFNEFICSESPDGRYTVKILVEDANPKNWDVTIHRIVTKEKPDEPRERRSFILTPFDFPFTDNTLIDRNNRFSLVVNNVGEFNRTKKVELTIVWFPEGFISPRERPINYNEIRKILGLGEDEG